MVRLAVQVIRWRAWLFTVLAGAGFLVGGRLAQGEPAILRTPVILIDPGHGGIDGGCGRRDILLEKDLNLAVAQRLARELARFRLSPALTRMDDRHLGPTHRRDLLARVAKANEIEADLVVCLHADWGWDRRRSGPCVFYHRTAQSSRLLAELLQIELAKASGTRHYALPARDLLVIREVKRPAVLIEMGFLSNPEEAAKLADPAYQDSLARAISVGIINFLLTSG